jgi:hypothetical protein
MPTLDVFADHPLVGHKDPALRHMHERGFCWPKESTSHIAEKKKEANEDSLEEQDSEQCQICATFANIDVGRGRISAEMDAYASKMRDEVVQDEVPRGEWRL